MTFFCGGPKGMRSSRKKPDCPQSTSGMITGTTNAGDIIALNSDGTDQALDSHDFAGFLRALRAGAGYANMHTTRFPGAKSGDRSPYTAASLTTRTSFYPPAA